MAINFDDDKQKQEIMKTINRCKDSLLKDINLSLRITYNEKSYVTKIVDWRDDVITFYSPMDKMDWVILEHGINLQLCFISKSGLFMTHMNILGKYMNNGSLYYNAVIASPIIRNQQREHFRLDVLMNVSFKILPPGVAEPNLDTLTSYRGTTVNISVGGLCLVCDHKMERNDRIYMEFKFLDTELKLIGELLEAGEKNSVGAYNHRIRFIDLDRRKENLLSSLIFKKQRLLMTQSNIPLQK